MGKRKSSPRLATTSHQMLLVKVFPGRDQVIHKTISKFVSLSEREWVW